MTSTDTSRIHSSTGPPAQHETRLSSELELLPGYGSSIAVLRLAGEIDALSHAYVETALAAALLREHGPLVVDLSALTFCSVRGFGLLAEPVNDELGRRPRRSDDYAMAGLAPTLERAAAILWTTGHPVRYPSTVAAVQALHAAALKSGA